MLILVLSKYSQKSYSQKEWINKNNLTHKVKRTRLKIIGHNIVQFSDLAKLLLEEYIE